MTRVNAESYLKSKKVHELFVFLASHLVVADQDDPIDYLIDLLDQCMLFRADLRNPPLLFSPEHLEAVFRAFDPAGTGVISRDQYEQGMTTLGISEHQQDPEVDSQGRVEKEFFVAEATRCLTDMLVKMTSKNGG